MIYPPFDVLTPGPLNCPAGTFDKNGFCFPSSNVDSYYREIPIEPYTKRPIQWYHNQNLMVAFPKVVDSLIYTNIDGSTSYFAPSGYQLGISDEKISNIIPSLFEDYFLRNFPKLNNTRANLSPIDYGSHSDPVIYPSNNPNISFDPRITYPEGFPPALELCPKDIIVKYKVAYRIWYGDVDLGIIEVIAHANFGYAYLFSDHYTFDQIPEFFTKVFVPSSGEGGLSYTVRGDSLCFYANGAFAFSAMPFNAVNEPILPEPFLLIGNSLDDSDLDCSISTSIFDLLPSGNFTALGQACEIISIAGRSYRSLAGIEIETFANGPALCGDYDSSTCWARHQLELQVPIYRAEFQIDDTGDYLVVTNNLVFDSYNMRTQSFFRFCNDEFSNSSHKIDYQIYNYWIRDLAFDLPMDPNSPDEVQQANYSFWDSIFSDSMSYSLENPATLYMPLINNLNIPGDMIPIIGGAVTPQPRVDLIVEHSFRYIYNASPLENCPDWPPQSGLTVSYDSPTLPGSNILIAGEPCGGS